ncbi:MAG: methyltransferase domain-containing protein [Thomasclavelia sp.]
MASSKVKEVIGVEVNKDAVKDAINNAKMNKISNIKFVNDDATAFMIKLAKQKQKVDCIIMDPPQAEALKNLWMQ